MKLVWDNAPNGVVSVSWDGTRYVAPVLSGRMAATADHVIATWEPLVREICETTKGYEDRPLPVVYGLAHIIVESGGDPHAFRNEGHDDANGRPVTGVGLLQITAPGLKGSHSDEKLFDPRLNLSIGLHHLAYRWRTGIDLVATTSMWNAGAQPNGRPWPSEKSPYGFREYIVYGTSGAIIYDHITAILRANNTVVLRGSGVGFTGDVANQANPPPASSPPGAIARAPKHDVAAGLILAGLFALAVAG